MRLFTKINCYRKKCDFLRLFLGPRELQRYTTSVNQDKSCQLVNELGHVFFFQKIPHLTKI